MKEVVATLSKLAVKANAEANALKAKKDKKSEEQAQALFAKQAKIATFIQTLEQTQAAVDSYPEMGSHSVKTIFNEYLAALKADLAPITAMSFSDKKLTDALNSATTNGMLDLASNQAKALKRNVELRRLAARAMEEKGTAEDLAAYNKRCQEDDALRKLISTNKQNFFMQLENANLQWADFLKQRFEMKDLPENKEPEKVVLPNQKSYDTSFIKDFFKGAIKAVGGLFMDLTKSGFKDTKGPLMKFLGNIIPMVIGFFGNLLKPLFGKDFGDVESSIADLAKSASSFVSSLGDDEVAPPAVSPSVGDPFLPAYRQLQEKRGALSEATAKPATKNDNSLIDGIASLIAGTHCRQK